MKNSKIMMIQSDNLNNNFDQTFSDFLFYKDKLLFWDDFLVKFEEYLKIKYEIVLNTEFYMICKDLIDKDCDGMVSFLDF